MVKSDISKLVKVKHLMLIFSELIGYWRWLLKGKNNIKLSCYIFPNSERQVQNIAHFDFFIGIIHSGKGDGSEAYLKLKSYALNFAAASGNNLSKCPGYHLILHQGSKLN